MNQSKIILSSSILGPAILLISLIGISGCGRTPDTTDLKPIESPLVTFAAMGDVPYGLNPEEVAAEKVILRRQIADLNKNADIEFVVHVGDIKKGAPQCLPEVYETVVGILRKSTHPVFIIPGDNEWNDCQKPEEAWKQWITNFTRFDENWPNSLGVVRQPEREENFAFLHNRVLFIGINLVNGKVHDFEEWESRIEDDRKWLERQFQLHSKDANAAVLFIHANPGKKMDGEFQYSKQAFRPLIEYLDKDTAADFPKPILLIHGDGHKWIKDHPFPSAGDRITRIQVTQGGLEAPLKVEVMDDPTNPFRLTRN